MKMAEELPTSQAVMEGEGDESDTEENGEELVAAAKGGKYPCIRCQKKVAKAGVRCNTCHLWVHNNCQEHLQRAVCHPEEPGQVWGHGDMELRQLRGKRA